MLIIIRLFNFISNKKQARVNVSLKVIYESTAPACLIVQSDIITSYSYISLLCVHFSNGYIPISCSSLLCV
jgi:hypothetical protein